MSKRGSEEGRNATLKIILKPVDPRTGPGDALLEKGRIAEALAYFGQALKVRPDDPGLLRGMADALVMNHRYREALPVYLRAAEKSPSDQELYELLAGVHTKLGEKEQGRRILRAFFSKHPLAARRKTESAGPTILKILGLDGTFGLLVEKKNKRPGARYRGGHFTTTYLLPKQGYRVLDWTIADNNINVRDDIPAHDLLLNTIADADTERRSLLALSEYLKNHPKAPVINHPDRVLETTRDGNFLRLNAIAGITFPRTARFRREGMTAEAVVARIGEMRFDWPIVVRETGSHTGRTVELIRDDAELARYFSRSDGEEFYLIQFIDERIDDGRYFRKMRVFCIDGRLYPVVSHIDRVWIVHGDNRLIVMRENPWMQDQEQRYLADPVQAIGATNWRILENLYDLVGLDFFGVDFTVRRDGTLLIYELNASMRHKHSHAQNFPYMKPHMERITAAFGEMIKQKISG